MVSATRYTTPPELAERMQVKLSKIYAWIRSGELHAINVSDGDERPRWRITEADIVAFERQRKTAVHAVDSRRRTQAIPTPSKDHFTGA